MMLAAAWALALAVGFVQAEPSAPAWEHVVDWLEAESERFGADLDEARGDLLTRAESESSPWAARLRQAPAATVERGYGVLPRLIEDAAPAAVEARRMRYSLEEISTAYAWAIRDAAVLRRTASASVEALPALVDRYEYLRGKHANLQAHVSYHTYWQGQVSASPEPFLRRRETLALVEEWHRLQTAEDAASLTRRAQLRERFLEDLAPFQRSPGLAIRRVEHEFVLDLEIATDIEDDVFLERFATACHATYNDNDAARAAGFRLAVHFRRLELEELYSTAPPVRGDSVDTEAHRARFPAGALVLTTGGESTHAFVGEAIVLGADPLAPRTLAHEVGHLLGFRDAYLRTFEGDVAGPFGATLIEWTGLQDDLMGDSRRGPVTQRMIAKLLEAYGPEPVEGPASGER